MTITEIVVSAGRTFNHPYEQYSNLKPAVTVKAALSEDDNPAEVVRELQNRAEGWVEDHKQGLLRSIEELMQLTQRQAQRQGLERELKRAQDRLNAIRRENPGLALLPAGATSPGGDPDQATPS